ncbi:MAG: CHAT domain-containing protein, partial [Verrucomicrobiota bacterium]
MKQRARSILIGALVLTIPLFSMALSDEDWTEFPGVRESLFPQGYEVVDSRFEVIKVVDDFQVANVRAFQDEGAVRYYLSDWSFDRMQAGEEPNYIRAIVPERAAPDLLDHRATAAEQRIRRRIEDALNQIDFGSVDVYELSEYNGLSHFSDIVFAHHPLTFRTYQEMGKSYGLGHIFATPFDLDKTCMTIEWASGSAQGITNAVNQTLLKSPHRENFLLSLPEVFQSVVDVFLSDENNRVVNRPERNVAMPENSAYVEFVRTHSETYSSAYVANVYRNGSLVATEELFEAKAFDVFVELLLRNATKRNLVDPADASEWLDGFFTEVYSKTFLRFESLLSGVETVYWSGSGHFHFVPLELVLQNSESPLRETPLLRVKDSGSLANQASKRGWLDRGVLLVGDLDFDHESSVASTTSPSHAAFRGSIERAYVNREIYFSALPGTQVELEKLSALFAKEGDAVPTRVVKSREGTESSILEKLPSSGIAHFATHGFYLDDHHLSGENTTDPLVRSGLTLTGAN